MTRLLEKALARVAALPAEKQDRVAEMLFEFADGDDATPPLTPEQIEGVKRSLVQASRGEFASDESVKNLLSRPWA